jgi:RNA polymerase sigma-70 factor (ECF subfamily)
VASDEDLVGRVAEGEASALEELLRRYEHPLSSFLERRTGTRDIDDLYQETWMRVVRAAARFDRTRRFSTWLFQIATNLCRDRWRRPSEQPVAPDALDAIADPETVANRVDDVLALQKLLAELPDAQREALVLRYWHDMSEAEMSEILGCPAGTVKSRIHAALARLADLARREQS